MQCAQFHQLLSAYPGFLIFSDSVLEDCIFLETGPFHPHCPAVFTLGTVGSDRTSLLIVPVGLRRAAAHQDTCSGQPAPVLQLQGTCPAHTGTVCIVRSSAIHLAWPVLCVPGTKGPDVPG